MIATIAPIVASAVLFAVTRSAFTLVFALLGPVVAVATVADSAVHRRRARRVEEKRFVAELGNAADEIERAHTLERAELDRRHPSVLSWLRSGRPPTPTAGESVSGVVRLGRGQAGSGVVLGSARSGPGPVDPRLAELRADAETLVGAPLSVDAAHGLDIAGPRVLAAAVARAVLLQLVAGVSPGGARIIATPGPDWDWIADLPYPVDRSAPDGVVRIVGSGLDLTVVTGASPLESRPGRALIVIRGDGSAIVETGQGRSFELDPEFVSLEAASGAALGLRELAERSGLPIARDLPNSVAFARLDQASTPGLTAAIGVGIDGQRDVNLVRDGPHAIVGGTTGSGKSELLVTWVLAMAARRSPETVTFLFVDFKGGAAFDPLLPLPHCVGVITDLDAEQSLRALTSLGAELRRRERTLAALGLRSIDETEAGGAIPRLVVVVDEYAALVETHSSLHAIFADIAARGRSLGVHLVLCTQRPAGVVRDAILANCALRISLRVMTAADSTAVLGTDAASGLPARPIGRALVGAPGAAPLELQVARSDESDIERIVEHWRDTRRPPAPWLPPLGSHVELDWSGERAVDDGIPFAVADRPAEQSQDTVFYRPDEHGSLLVVGGAGSGESGVLAALAAGPTSATVLRLQRELPQLWDGLGELLTTAGPVGVQRRLLLVDDLDAIVAACDESYRPALLDRLTTLLREGPASGVHLVLTVQRVSGALQQLVALCGSLLVLRMPSRQEHVLAGGAAGEYSERLPPGAGHWRGERVQVYAVAPQASASRRPAVPPPVAVLPDLESGAITVVSTRPERFAARIRELAPQRHVVVVGAARIGSVPGTGEHHRWGDGELEVHAGGAPDILVADPETWQSQWSLLAAAQRAGGILLDGCSLAEVRAITRSRELPPPWARGARPLWLLQPDGDLVRVRLPAEPAPI